MSEQMSKWTFEEWAKIHNCNQKEYLLALIYLCTLRLAKVKDV